jgi:rfaE bifunctional protein kinase chain/domain
LENKVFLSGRFAVIHEGHFRLITQAKTMGESLIIGLQSDEYSNDEIEWRVRTLKSIDPKIQVMSFTGNVNKILEEIRPDIVVKGREFANLKNPESEIISKIGGKLVFASGSGISSELGAEVLQSEATGHLPLDFMRRHQIETKKLLEVIENFQRMKILVIGDLIIDEFISCAPLGMSQEDPVVVVTPTSAQKFLGGAGIVAAHCASMGATTHFLSLAGDDINREWALYKLADFHVSSDLVTSKDRITTHKQRFKSGNQTLFKLSHISQEFLSGEIEEEIRNAFYKNVEDMDVIIFSDFSYGALPERLVTEFTKFSRESKIFTAADCQTSSQNGDISKYRGVNLLTATEREARSGFHSELDGLVTVIRKITETLNIENVFLKLGSEGVLIDSIANQDRNFAVDQVPALSKKVRDVSGAGDSMLAISSLVFGLEQSIEIAAVLGSIAASIQIERTGNVPITIKELVERIQG